MLHEDQALLIRKALSRQQPTIRDHLVLLIDDFRKWDDAHSITDREKRHAMMTAASTDLTVRLIRLLAIVNNVYSA